MNLLRAAKEGINFVKKNPEIFYSLVLLVVIPSALWFNTTQTKKSLNSAADAFKLEMEYNFSVGDLILERVIEIFAADLISSPDILQKKVEEIVEKSAPQDKEETTVRANQSIAKIQLEIFQQDEFKTIAAYPLEPNEEVTETEKDARETETEKQIKIYKTLAWNQSPNESIMFETLNQNGERFRNLIKIIKDSSGAKIGLITLTTSLKYTDARLAEANNLLAKANNNSNIILLISLIFVVFLIFNHTKFFIYSTKYNLIREVDKMKDEFISMTAHELRTPITAIRGYADILKGEIGSTLNETQSGHLSRVIVSTERLNDLINDILDVSRIEQGRLSIEFQEVSPQKTIKEVVDELKVKADEKELQLVFEPKEEPYLISADPARLKQVLINIIGNSIKYTLKGKVEIETKAEELKGRGKYSISIKDTGLGMSAEAQKKLFEKFYRVKTKDTAEISGTGLGLWITRALTEKMEGEIFLESMEGVGSKFTIVFPLLKKRAQAQPQPQQTPQLAQTQPQSPPQPQQISQQPQIPPQQQSEQPKQPPPTPNK